MVWIGLGLVRVRIGLGLVRDRLRVTLLGLGLIELINHADSPDSSPRLRRVPIETISEACGDTDAGGYRAGIRSHYVVTSRQLHVYVGLR